MKSEAIEASLAASGAKATYGGAGVSLAGWFMQSNLLSVLGLLVAIAGFAVTWYYKAKQDRRDEEAHKARMSQMQWPTVPKE